MANRWTMSGILGDIEGGFDRLNNLLTGWHRGVLGERGENIIPCSGSHGWWTLHPDNLNYVLFVPDNDDELPEDCPRADFGGYVIMGSTVHREAADE